MFLSRVLFWDPFRLLLGPVGYKNHSKSLEKVIIFKQFVVFASSASLDRENKEQRSPGDS